MSKKVYLIMFTVLIFVFCSIFSFCVTCPNGHDLRYANPAANYCLHCAAWVGQGLEPSAPVGPPVSIHAPGAPLPSAPPAELQLEAPALPAESQPEASAPPAELQPEASAPPLEYYHNFPSEQNSQSDFINGRTGFQKFRDKVSYLSNRAVNLFTRHNHVNLEEFVAQRHMNRMGI